MRSKLKNWFIGIGWIALAVFLGSTKASEYETARVIAASIVALPTAWQFANYLLRPFEQINDGRRREIGNILQEQLLAVHSAGVYPDVPALSFHVWLLPQWHQVMMGFKSYRRFVKKKRERYERERRRSRRTVDPTLRRAGRVGFEMRQPTGVVFRNGEGIIGRCIRQNLKHKALAMALDSSDFQAALEIEDDEHWRAAPDWVRQNLDRRPAQKLASVYGQVAAEVLQRDGHAIGCITLDLPPNAPVRLTDQHGKPVHQPLLDHLKLAAQRVELNLTTQ